jgi:hypothetical protein
MAACMPLLPALARLAVVADKSGDAQLRLTA